MAENTTGNSSLIVADIFKRRDIEKVEKIFSEYFIIEKKDVITFNAKHALNLDKPRVEKVISKISTN